MELTVQQLIELSFDFDKGEANLHEWKKSRFLISKWAEMKSPENVATYTDRNGKKRMLNKSVLEAWKALNPNNEKVTS